MHRILEFIFGIGLYMFRTVSLSIIRSLALYTHQWYVIPKFQKWVKLLVYIKK